MVDGKLRYDEEAKLKELEAALSETTGKAEVLRAASVDSPFSGVDDLQLRLKGLDPQSPSVTQRAGRSYIWYKTSEGEVRVPFGKNTFAPPWR